MAATPEEITDAMADDAAEGIAEGESDGQKFKLMPSADRIGMAQHVATDESLTGTNQNGGPVSGWGSLRIARARPGGPND